MSTARTVVPVLIVWLSVAHSAVAQGVPEVIAEIGSTRIYQGESVLYQVTLNHVENPSPPQLEGFDDFDVAKLGEQALDSRQITIINGRRSETVRRGRAYKYRLTPRRAGSLQIPAPVAVVDGQSIRGRELTLEVVAPQDQDVVLMQTLVDRQSVYPMQPVSVTLSIAVKELPSSLSGQEPVRVLSTPPALQIPWVDDDRLPDGLRPKTEWRQWLLPMEDRRGFSVNKLGRSSVFSLFDERPSAFHPRPHRTRRTDRQGQEVGYWQYEFTRVFVPTRIGQYAFGPVTLKGMFATGVNAAGRVVGENIYAVAPQTAVTVKDVPRQGRPESYIGAVGEFRFEADLEPKKARVGDPMTLSIAMTGVGTLDSAWPPDLAKVPEVAERFRIYEPTDKTEGNTRRFTYSLRPKQEGITEFPSVEIAYFDVEKECYVTEQTAPIPVEVVKADRLGGHQIVATRNGSGTAARDVEVSREGIFQNVTDPSALRDESIRPGRRLVALAGLAGCYATAMVVIGQVRRRGSDAAWRRRRAAASRARTTLREAIKELSANRATAGADRVQAALVGLVADVANLPEAGLTPRDVEQQLRQLGIEDELVRRAGALLATCDAARYGASDDSIHSLGHEAEELLKSLTNHLKARKRFR